MIEIPLTQSKFAVVDDDDSDLLLHRWFAMEIDGIWYAARNRPAPGRGLILMHRQIMGDVRLVDHRDGDGLNNRRGNLREASRSGNRANSRPQKNGTSRFKGVHWSARRERWVTKLHHEGRNVYVGQYADEEEAAKAHDRAARKHFGEFARLNFPEAV